MTVENERDLGERLLSAVERLIEPDEQILAIVASAQRDAQGDTDRAARALISRYANRSALVGGATALPAFLPGLGTACALVVGPLADLVCLLKFETEMCLALAAVHGYDIAEPHERQLAFLLAALKTSEASAGRSAVHDGVSVVGTSIWNYGPRRVGKLLVTVLASLGAALVTRNLARAIPLIGVAVGAGLNRALTSRVGHNAHEELLLRRRLAAAAPLAS